MTELASRLPALGGVPADYRHRPKRAEPGPPLLLDDACLKWYDVHGAGESVPVTVRAAARDFIRRQAAEGGLDLSGALGFAILHRCDGDVYYLDVCTWRHANELWESVYVADPAAGGTFRRHGSTGHVEVGCVWELGVVRHEVEAWDVFLGSVRDDAAKLAYLTDQLTGPV
ncbi:hypothetical protein [Micromonospora sp. NPDC126480]|uniref:hypothetical protein n=1 Tax=Micromonospora sp. NPDC126480 TaxID=3155312 RepID=UPI00332C4DDC